MLKAFTTLVVIAAAFLLPRIALAQFNPDQCSSEEAWLPVGDGLPGAPTAACVHDGYLYVAYRINRTEHISTIARWNGTVWEHVADIDPSDIFLPETTDVDLLLFYNDELYAGCGGFIDENLGEILRWDGVSWHDITSLSGGLYSSSLYYRPTVCEYRGELYMEMKDSTQQSMIKAWNGTQWRTVIKQNKDENLDVASMTVWQGDLYICGQFSHIGNTPVSNIARFDGSTWSEVGTWPKDDYCDHFMIFNDQLYVAYWNESTFNGYLRRWDQTHWTSVNAFENYMPPFKNDSGSTRFRYHATQRPYAIHDGDVYCSIYRNDEDQQTGRFIYNYRLLAWDGLHNRKAASFDFGPAVLIEYKGELYAGGYFFASCDVPLHYIAKLRKGLQHVPGVAGSVYRDLNGNCRRDSSEPGLRQRIIEQQPGSIYRMTDANGDYHYLFDTGTYTLRLAPRQNWTQTCPAAPGTQTVVLSANDTSATEADFASAPVMSIHDLRIADAGDRAVRPGQRIRRVITVQNYGTENDDATVELSLDPLLTFDTSDVAPASKAPDRIVWELGKIAADESRSINVWETVSKSAKQGDTMCLSVALVGGDVATGTDRADSICLPVRNSLDPNWIAVKPSRTADGNIYTTDSVLIYTIQFQNVGSADAIRVMVTDSLDDRLDPATFLMRGASHPYQLEMHGHGVLTWVFDSINLPAEQFAGPSSEGFVQYSIHRKPGLPIGTSIANSAQIVFDFNQAIGTNTVVSTIVARNEAGIEMGRSAERVTAFPNPARDAIYLRGALNAGSTIILRDLLGRINRIYRCDSEGAATLDLTGVPAGSYLLQMGVGKEIRVEKVTITR